MGRAATDLPDPLQQDAAPMPRGKTLPTGVDPPADELISQMAGQEIDRLLAEAGADAAPAAAGEAPATVVPPEPVEEAEKSAEPLAPQGSADAAAKAVETAHAPVLEAAGPAVAVAAARPKLDLDLGSLPATPAKLRRPRNRSQPSILTRLLSAVLRLVNSPVPDMPDETRQVIGKIALLTIFNAAAVLVYVLLFRRHTH